MTQPHVNGPRPSDGATWHVDRAVLAGYAAGALDEVPAWSVEAHLEVCATCRTAVSAHVDAELLARNRAVVMTLIAVPDSRWLSRAARWCAVPDHLLRLIAATPSLRRSWLLSVLGVLTVVTVEAVLVGFQWPGGAPPEGMSGLAAAQLAPFLLVGPLLVLAGVAAAFMPALDPGYRLAVAAPFSGLELLLLRSAAALITALIPVVVAAFVVPGPGWLPAAVVLPSLAVCVFALAAATVVGPVAAVVVAGALWAVPLMVLVITHSLLVSVQSDGQVLCAVVLAAAAVGLFLRRGRLEIGWVR